MPFKLTDQSIDLSGLGVLDYTDDEVKSFRRVRTEYARLFHPIIQTLAAQPTLLHSNVLQYSDLAQQLERILSLEEAEAWLAEYSELVSETRRAALHQIKPQLDQLADLGRSASSIDPKIHSLFAKLFDYLSEPGKQASATRRASEKPTPDNG